MENKLAYLAGIIDGEGSIKILKRKGAHGEINPLYYFQLDVSNTSLELMKFLKHNFGGNVKEDRRNYRPNHYRTVYKWIPTQTTALEILNCVYKYLVSKRNQADIIFKLRETYKSRCCRLGTPSEVLSIREYCYNELKRMHHNDV